MPIASDLPSGENPSPLTPVGITGRLVIGASAGSESSRTVLTALAGPSVVAIATTGAAGEMRLVDDAVDRCDAGRGREVPELQRVHRGLLDGPPLGRAGQDIAG